MLKAVYDIWMQIPEPKIEGMFASTTQVTDLKFVLFTSNQTFNHMRHIRVNVVASEGVYCRLFGLIIGE